ncbi:MAG: extracellular solute-binding protein [Eubacteriales bacterium]|nr:extracellular solute-binding protein [Eubacteriales bacterium]
MAITLCLSLLLTMCVIGGASAEDVQTIRMWSNDQHDQKVINAKIEEFNETIGKEKGIAVEYTVYGSDYYSTLDVAVSADQGPDIFKCNKIGNYAEAGYIIPWESEPALKSLVDRFSFYNAPGYGEFFDQTYSVPIRVTTYGIACNNEIFAANGLELPTTWQEMQDAARVITENGRGRQYGYALAMGYGSYHYFYVTLANGASTGDEYFNHTTGKYDFASLSGFLNHVKAFITDGSMFPGFETMDGDTARAQFSAGNIGMIGVMSSDVTTFKNQFPCDFEWTMIPYPAQDAANRYKEPVGVSMSYVIGNAAQKGGYTDKVAEFLNFLYSDELFVATNDAQVDISILGNEITSQSTNADLDPNWIRFSDMDVFSIKYPNPDSNLTIEGDTYQDVISKIITGVITDADAALNELDVKYNAALDAAVAAGKVKLEDYIDSDIAAKMQWTK